MSYVGLLELAKERFRDDWTDADETLFRQTEKGEIADYGEGDPAEADKWGEDRVLLADRIVWLCTDQQAVKEVTRRGTHIRGARIEGILDLSFAKIAFPLAIRQSATRHGITMLCTHLSALYLDGTHTGPIIADGLTVEHGLFMRNGFQAAGEVRLVGATIGGNLECDNSRFNNPDGDALSADAVEVEGGVFFNNQFQATGEVRLLGAKIGGNLECDNSHFTNPNGKALSADNVGVAGSVFFQNGFKATGEVRLHGATIGGTLDCSKGHFTNPNGKALSADGVDVKGNVFLGSGFQATGEVRVVGAKIGGNLSCENARFANPGWRALNAGRVAVKGHVFLRDHFVAEGVVDLTAAFIGGGFQWRELKRREGCTLRLESAKIGTLWDEEESWPAKLYLDGLVYDRLYSDAPPGWKERLKWLALQDSGKFFPQPYVQLAKVLEEMGHEADARKILIAKQEDPARVRGLTIPQRVRHTLFGVTIGYGYRPWRAGWWILAFILIGTLLFWIGFDNGGFVETKEGTVPTFNAFVYSVDAFVPLVDLYQAKYRLPVGWFLRGYHWVHISLGWVLTTLLVVGLTGLVRK